MRGTIVEGLEGGGGSWTMRCLVAAPSDMPLLSCTPPWSNRWL